jgi:glycerol-3-phosphate dehydrogenase (NAD(P)+)
MHCINNICNNKWQKLNRAALPEQPRDLRDSMQSFPPITVLGAGSWGTALAILLAHNQQDVRLWDHDPRHCDALSKQRTNQRYLPDIKFPEKLHIYSDLAEALLGVQDILVVVPSHAFRSVIVRIQPLLHARPTRIVWGSKGLDPQSGKLLHEVVKELLGDKTPLAFIAGPSFAKEVALNLPTAVTLAHNNQDFAQNLLQRLHNPNFRLYLSDDLVGAQVAGAVKNILAIAVGASDGLRLGANARCALITRGLAEMMRLGKTLGGRADTFMGLAGLGDLILTATDDQSRNRRFGLALGRGMNLQQAEKEIGLVEGVSNATRVYALAQSLNVDMPITEQVYRLLNENLSPADAVKALLSRQLKEE